jgi:hypothetical protein
MLASMNAWTTELREELSVRAMREEFRMGERLREEFSNGRAAPEQQLAEGAVRCPRAARAADRADFALWARRLCSKGGLLWRAASEPPSKSGRSC